jgi:hypothetical protein
MVVIELLGYLAFLGVLSAVPLALWTAAVVALQGRRGEEA